MVCSHCTRPTVRRMTSSPDDSARSTSSKKKFALYLLALTAFSVTTTVFGFRRFAIGTSISKLYTRKAYSIEKTEQMKTVRDSTEIEKVFFHESFKNIFIVSATERSDYARLAKGVVSNSNQSGIGACNESPNVHVIGWEHKDYETQPVKYCYLWETGNISAYLNPGRHYYLKHRTVLLRSIHYECCVDRKNVTLQGVHIQVGKSSCASVRERYVQPVQPSIPTTSGMIVISLKIIFGIVDALWLVEWFEYYKDMKVDKVFLTLYKDVSEQVRRVVQFYIEEGMVEMKPFDIPWTRELVRSHDQKNYQTWDDKQVIVSDFAVRYRGYTYIMIIDLDEFLVPAEGNIKHLMSRLMKKYPIAAGFTFYSTLLLRSWGNTSMYGSSVVSQYLQGTETRLLRAKYVAVSDRTKIGSHSSHGFKPLEGFKNIHVPEEFAQVYHYRFGCYPNEVTVCNGTRYNRTDVLEIIRKTEPSSLAVKKKLNLI